jgi:hypothetical protein
MTMILDPTIRSLSEYLRLKERNKNPKKEDCPLVPKRPDTCPHCSEDQCFWIKAYYFRWVVEGELTEQLRVPRYICKCCGLVLSVLFAFLVPYRQLSLQTLVRGVQDYMLRKTSYRRVASSIGNNEDSIQRPSHSQIWHWVQLFSTRSFESLEIVLQRACVTAGKEKQLTPAICLNSVNAQSIAKVRKLNSARRLLALGWILLEPKQNLVQALQTYFTEIVQPPFSILTGRGITLTPPQSLNHIRL